MEFKARVKKKRKAQRIRNRKARGMQRVEVRGRKRWVQPAKVVSE